MNWIKLRYLELIFFNIFLLLTINIYSQTTNSRVFKLKTLENKEVNFSMYHDYYNKKITCKTGCIDSICINEYCDLSDSILILKDKFILIKFRVGGGFGTKYRRAVLICVSENKIYRALDIYYLVGNDVPLDLNKDLEESGMYEFRIQSIDKNFKLIATDFEEIIFKYQPKNNLKFEETYQLNFDFNKKIFYKEYATLKGLYHLENDKKKYDSIMLNGNKYPAIVTKRYKYYFINHSWYFEGIQNYLNKFSSSCNLQKY